MTDRHDEPRDANDLADRVAELGDTPEGALEEVADRNASLEERLPREGLGDEQPVDKKPGDEGPSDEGRGDEEPTSDDDARDTSDMPRGEGAPGQG